MTDVEQLRREILGLLDERATAVALARELLEQRLDAAEARFALQVAHLTARLQALEARIPLRR
jgi:hypothetical protein